MDLIDTSGTSKPRVNAPDSYWDLFSDEEDTSDNEDYFEPTDVANYDNASDCEAEWYQEEGDLEMGPEQVEPAEDEGAGGEEDEEESNSGRGDEHTEPGQHKKLDSVKRVLDALKAEHLSLGAFLDAVMWGDRACVTDATVQRTRMGFLDSGEFKHLVQRWWKPPHRRRRVLKVEPRFRVVNSDAINFRVTVES